MNTFMIMMMLTNAALVIVNIVTLKSIRAEVRKLLFIGYQKHEAK